MLELCVTMMIFGVLSAMAVGSFVSLRNAHAQKGAQREVVSSMRAIQARAVSEGTTFCVDFGGATSTQWNIYRVPAAGTGTLPSAFACSTGTKVAGPEKLPVNTSLTGISFSQRNGLDTTFALFYPRGAASPGSLSVTRTGSAKTYSLTVDALTGRVSTPNGD